MTGTAAGAAIARRKRTNIKHDRWIRELSAAGWAVIQAGHITLDARPSLDLIEVYADCTRCYARIGDWTGDVPLPAVLHAVTGHTCEGPK